MIMRNQGTMYLFGLCLILFSYTPTGTMTSGKHAVEHKPVYIHKVHDSTGSLKDIYTNNDTNNKNRKKYRPFHLLRKTKVNKNKAKNVEKSGKINNNEKKSKITNIFKKVIDKKFEKKSIDKKTLKKSPGNANYKRKKQESQKRAKKNNSKYKAMRKLGGTTGSNNVKADRQNIDMSSSSSCDQTHTLVTFSVYNVYTSYVANDKDKKECSITFKGFQDNDKLYLVCQEFNLQSKCKKESLKFIGLKSGTEDEYCGSSLKTDQSTLESEGNSLTLVYARKKLNKRQCGSDGGFFCQIIAIPDDFVISQPTSRGINTELNSVKSWIGLGAEEDICDQETTLDYGNTAMVYSSYGGKGKAKCKHTIKGPDDVNLNVKCSVFDMQNSCKKERLEIFDEMSTINKKRYCESTDLSKYSASGNMLEFAYNRKRLKRKQCHGTFMCYVSVPNVICGDQWPTYDFPYCDIVNNVAVCSCSEFEAAGGCDDGYQQPDYDFCKRTCQICDDLGLVDESNKPGECPNLGDFIGTCEITALSCTSDDECPSSSKCCSFGCGKQCILPDIPKCEPGTYWTQSCEQCQCLDDGIKDCQYMLDCYYCPPSNPNHPNCGVSPSCVDGSSWEEECNMCYCEKGVPICTLIGCPIVKTTEKPTAKTTEIHTAEYTKKITGTPTDKTTENATVNPIGKPTEMLIVKPTGKPTGKTTSKPTENCDNKSTSQPSVKSTVKTTEMPREPTEKTSDKLSEKTTLKPTEKPVVKTTMKPTVIPTVKSTMEITIKPTIKPTLKPTEKPNPSTETRPYCDECGTSSVNLAPSRIIGGQQATPGEYPWQVLLRISASSYSDELRCGASIIKKRWLLSASHCFIDLGTITRLIMHLGAHSLNDANMKVIEYTQQDVATRVTTHPNYNIDTIDNDISLIELKEDLVFNNRISPVCLADAEDFVVGKQGVATGWGRISADGYDVSDVLLEVGLNLIDLARCKELYQNTPTIYDITDNMLCTLTTGKDTCGGDSGGPLVVKLANGRWVQIGITSFGYKCAYPNAPGVWVNAAKYKTWIDLITGSNQC